MNQKIILVVGDSLTEVLTFKTILHDAGYSINEACDGVEVVDYLKSAAPLPDLILTDIFMPNIDGFELCRQLKESYKNIPVIILTAHNDEENLHKAFDAGAEDFLGIPFSKTELLVRINNVLKTQSIIKKKLIARRKFQESEEQLAILIRTIPDIIYKVDVDGKFTFVSESIKQLGYSPKELVGRYFREFIHPDDFESVDRCTVLEKQKGIVAGNTGPPKLFNERRTVERISRDLKLRLLLKKKDCNSKDCRYFNIHFSVGQWSKPVNEENKVFLGSVGIASDISSRIQAEDELAKKTGSLKERIKELNCLYEISKLAEKDRFSIQEICQEIVNIIPSACQYPELSCAKLIIENVKYISGNFIESKCKLCSDIIVNRKKYGLLEIFYIEDNSKDDKGSSIKEEKDLINAIAQRLGKIIERKKAMKKLKKSEEFNKLIINTSNDCIKILDLDGHLLSMSISGQKLMEIDDITPYLNISWIDLWKGKDREVVQEAVSESKKDKIVTFMGYCETVRGTPKWWKVIISPIKDANNNIYNLLAVSHDITGLKKLDKQIIDLAKFQEENTNPVYRISKDGVLLYANLASRRLIKEFWTKVDSKIPEKWIKIIKDVFDSGKKQTIEIKLNGKFFLFEQIPVIEGGYVNVYATDITESKKIDIAFKKIFYSAKDALSLTFGNNIIDCNNATVKLLNAESKQDILITHPSQLSPEKQPDGRYSFEKANEMMDIAYKKGFHRFEWMHKKITGEVFPVEVSLTAIEYNHKLMLHALWKDLTKEKEKEEQLKKSRALERMFLDSLPHPAMIINQKRKIIAANKVALEAGAQLQSYCWKEFGKTDYISREDKLRCKKGDIDGIKCSFCLADKALKKHTITNNPEIKAFGKVWDIYWKYIDKDNNGDSLFFHYAIDITERKKAEAVLFEQQEFNKNIIETAQFIILVLDLEGKIVKVNSYFEKITGYSLEEIKGKDWFTTFLLTKEHDKIKNLFKKAINSTETVDNSNKILTKSGELLDIHWYYKTLKDSKSNILGITAVGVNITEFVKQNNELQKSEKRFKDISFSTGSWFWETDEKGVVTYCSKNISKVLGYQNNEIIGKTLFYFMSTKQAEKTYCLFAEIVKQKKPIVDFENWAITKSGKEICLLTNGTPMIDNNGRLIGYQGIDKEITESKKAEDKLRIKNQAIESSINAIAFSDLDGNLTYVNNIFLKVWGYKSKEEVIGKKAVDFWDINEKAEKVIQSLNETGGWSGELRGKKKDGTLFFVHLSSSMVFDQEEKPFYIMASFLDITEKKQMEKIINDREITLRNMYDSKLMGFLLWDADGEIIDSNDTFLKMLGYSREEFFSKNIFWQDIIPKNYAERDSIILSELAADKPVSPFEDKYICKNGNWLSVLVGATVLPDPGIGGAAFVLDITERRKLEAQLRQAEKMEAVGQLSGGIAHDFNNILAVILANAEASLKNISKDEDQTRNSLKEIISASQHAKNVVKQLLLFARKTEIKKMPIKINVLVRNALTLVRATLPSTIDIHSYISERVGTIYADPTQINQIMLNLCTNATHAMEEAGGSIKINLINLTLDETSIILYENLKPGKYVQLTVADTGHGIKQEHKKQLFEPYFTTKPVDKGTGLGLAVIHGIVKDLKGGIFVESEPGQGTIFKILFPQTEVKLFREKKNTIVKSSIQLDNNIRILLVDDEEAVLRSMKLILQMRGFRVVCENNPLAALKLLQSDPGQIDLIITDMTMPGICGDELAIKALQIKHDIPIILCTGFNDKIDEKKARKIGIRKYMEKPYTSKELYQAIHEVMGEKD